jgi:hypothetical protein
MEPASRFTAEELPRTLGISEAQVLELAAQARLPFTVTSVGLHVDFADLGLWQSAARLSGPR